jgi:ribosomal protein S18 acetylase RimI-like enzyme
MEDYPCVDFRKIIPADEAILSRFFQSVTEQRLDRQFHPHPFTPTQAQQVSCYDGLDLYIGGFIKTTRQDNLTAYGMLRGWDGGYKIPSLGICVLQEYQNKGLGSTLMKVLIANCRIRNSPAIRLKVYPDNIKAITLYKSLGFIFSDQIEDRQLVGYLNLM